MDKELLYNGSGVKDITAYKAILQSGGTGNMNNYEINKGEIWEVDNNGSTRLVVVLACFERYAATVMLQEQLPGSNAVEVRARDIMYADAGRLGYMFYDKMVDFVRTLSDTEYQELRQGIATALGLQGIKGEVAASAIQVYENATAAAEANLEAARQEITILREDLAKAQEEIDNQAEELEAAANRVAALEEEKKKKNGSNYIAAVEESELRKCLAMAEREAEIYKKLYEDLLARALG